MTKEGTGIEAVEACPPRNDGWMCGMATLGSIALFPSSIRFFFPNRGFLFPVIANEWNDRGSSGKAVALRSYEFYFFCPWR